MERLWPYVLTRCSIFTTYGVVPVKNVKKKDTSFFLTTVSPLGNLNAEYDTH